MGIATITEPPFTLSGKTGSWDHLSFENTNTDIGDIMVGLYSAIFALFGWQVYCIDYYVFTRNVYDRKLRYGEPILHDDDKAVMLNDYY